MKPYVLRQPDNRTAAGQLSVRYDDELNGQQLAAVRAIDGAALVIAGAGSGKTRTLVYRVAHLIDVGVDPASILLLTFTRKAAEEMVRRVGQLVGRRSERVTGGTFHSVANLLLRRYGRAIGVEPGFTILDRGDAEDLINVLRTQLRYGEHGRRFPRKNTIAELFSKSVNTLQTLEDVLFNEYPHFSDHFDALHKLRRSYEETKRQRQLLDYDDLLVKLRELLEGDEQVRRIISDTYRYILVDEYQDTNRLQAVLVRDLATTHDNVMAVGDDSQSIYAFRGATVRNILDFPILFPGAVVYKLEENYRSHQPILTVANAVLEGASEKYTKHLFTQKKEGPLPAVAQVANERDQSRFVAQKILELREEGVPLHDMAVLFRSSFHSFDLEVELSRWDVPFEKRGGMKFAETAHVKDLLAHLRILVNPVDSVSWNRLLQLVEGIGPKKARDLLVKLVESHEPLEVLRSASTRTRGLIGLVRTLEQLVNDQLAPTEQVGRLLEYYVPLLKEHYDDYPKRLRDLEHLAGMADRYRHLPDFLSDLALEPPEERVLDIDATDRDQERLVLSTIHSAKGLEWTSVFLIWIVDGRFPSTYAFLSEDQLEEERRLFYVAITRAKHHLFLTYPINIYDRFTGTVLSKPTRFLEQVSAEDLETWAVIDEQGFRAWE